MRKLNVLGFFALLIGVACNQSSNESVAGATDDTTSEVVTEIQVPADSLIVPGQKIGKLYLGQNVEEVFKIMGKADGGDAAMGKAWGIWYDKSSGNGKPRKETAVYSSYKDSTMMARDVKQIKVNAPSYKTEEGLGAGTSLQYIRAAFKDLSESAVYINQATIDSLFIYDAEKEGIAFEVKNVNSEKICTGISVHPKGESVNSTYLTIYPGWTKLK